MHPNEQCDGIARTGEGWVLAINFHCNFQTIKHITAKMALSKRIYFQCKWRQTELNEQRIIFF